MVAFFNLLSNTLIFIFKGREEKPLSGVNRVTHKITKELEKATG